MNKKLHHHQHRDGEPEECVLTNSDGVDLALHLEGALVALVGVDHLLELRVTDHQTLNTILVLLYSHTNTHK